MAVYSRTIGRQVTNALPAWAAAISSTDTLYEVGARFDDPVGGLNSKLVFPEGTFGGGLYNGTDGYLSPFHDSYGSAVYVPELGAHGGMVFGSTGENIIQEQLSYWALSKDSPTWEVFQQPDYATSAAQAAARGAAWYRNVAEYDALPANRKIPFTPGTGYAAGEEQWGIDWDRGFPVGKAGWIIPGKCGPSELGNNRPMAFRYNMPVYIPKEMTGWSAGAIVINDRSWHGPFAGNGGPPANVSASDWFLDNWPSGGRKYRIWAMNVVTRQWTIVATIPEFTISYGGNTAQPYAFVDPVAKRVYYTTNAFSNECLYYVDFASGVAGATVAMPTVLTAVGGGGADWSQSHSNAELFIGKTGALAGRKLYYYKNGLNGLGMIDLSTYSIYRLTGISNLPPSGQWGFAIDQDNARVHVLVKNTTTNAVTRTSFTIPNDPTSGANYSMSTVNVNMNGISLEVPAGPHGWQYGSRNRLLTSVGNFVIINQRQGKMLAVRLGA